jgi:hypothetical protein
MRRGESSAAGRQRRRLFAAVVLLSAAAVGATLADSTTMTPGIYFGTARAGTGLPRDDRRCASLVVAHPSFEPRPDNRSANETVPGKKLRWPDTPGQVHWQRWIARRDRVTGRYTGTTDEIIRWAACKWGVDEDTIRAVAFHESDWHQSMVGDDGSSFGLMQVKDQYPDGSPDLGGYPWTQRATALNVDFYAAWIRSCLDGDFYDGGPWLYGTKTISQTIRAKGFNYAFWGCIGAWYAGAWYTSGARNYIAQVKIALAQKAWRELHG